MNDLLQLIRTPKGHQSQHAVGGFLSEPTQGWTGISALSDVLTIPHHGQFTSPTFTLYDLAIAETEPSVQFNFPSGISNFSYLSERLKHNNDAIRNGVKMDLNIMHGNPVFQGTRIPIYQIIEELADGTSLQDVLEGYPSLTLEKIQTGLDFAASVVRIYDDKISDR